MSGGSDIDYELRPAKGVDRKIFLDLLSRYQRWVPLDGAVYISMGGYPMSDHRMIYRRFGLEHLISIDGEKHVVDRQRFNKPTEKTKCLHLRSNILIENFDKILSENEIPDTATRVVWMDFTEPNKLSDQLSQFEQLLETLGEGDIIRITLNANESSLKMAKPDGSKPKPVEVAAMDREEQREARFKRLENDLGSYLPSSATAKDLSNDKLPILLGKLLEKAAGSAFPSGSSQHAFFPLSSLVYRDGQQMITVTGAIIDRHHFDQVEVIMALENWPFSVEKISDFKRLSVSTLTLKERLLMERLVLADGEVDIVERLGFSRFGSTDAKTYFEDFKEFSRFYPNHAVVEY